MLTHSHLALPPGQGGKPFGVGLSVITPDKKPLYMCARNEEKLTHKVFARVSKRKYDELTAMLEQSRCQTLGALIRDILYNKEIVTVIYDASLDKVMAELSAIRTQLKAIGTNINQVTRKLHGDNLPRLQLELLLELTRLYQQADLRVAGLFTTIEKLSEKWLPE